MAPSAMAGAGLIDPEYYLDIPRNTFDRDLIFEPQRHGGTETSQRMGHG